MNQAGSFKLDIPIIEGWYEAVFQDQPLETFEYVYFKPGSDRVTIADGPIVVVHRCFRPLGDVVAWGARVPDGGQSAKSGE